MSGLGNIWWDSSVHHQIYRMLQSSRFVCVVHLSRHNYFIPVLIKLARLTTCYSTFDLELYTVVLCILATACKTRAAPPVQRGAVGS